MSKLASGLTSILIAAVASIAGCTARQPMESEWRVLVSGGAASDELVPVEGSAWVTSEGALQATPDMTPASYLVTSTSYADFVIQTEFWVSDDANSGIFIRCADPKDIGFRTCYEVNIYDQRPDPTYGTGSIVNVAAVNPMPKAGGKWNVMEITAQGKRLKVLLNGEQAVDVEDGSHSAGPIALQWGKGVVRFRSVQIKAL